MHKDFECHITLRDNATAAKEAVRKLGGGWKFSCIDGDPLFGEEVLCYATNHFAWQTDAYQGIDQAVYELKTLGMTVIRSKIEHVIEDIRY